MEKTSHQNNFLRKLYGTFPVCFSPIIIRDKTTVKSGIVALTVTVDNKMTLQDTWCRTDKDLSWRHSPA